MRAISLETGTAEKLDLYRAQVYGWTSDQGHEFSVASAPHVHVDGDRLEQKWADAFAKLRDNPRLWGTALISDLFAFPNALEIPD
eukprot:8498456-Pyramimonas_sp.AAC.1